MSTAPATSSLLSLTVTTTAIILKGKSSVPHRKSVIIPQQYRLQNKQKFLLNTILIKTKKIESISETENCRGQ